MSQKQEKVLDGTKESLEEVAPVKELTPKQKETMEKNQRNIARNALKGFKTRLKESNELKELQVRELQLNIAFYENQEKWLGMMDKVADIDKKLEELERTETEKLRAKQQENKIEVVKHGKSGS